VHGLARDVLARQREADALVASVAASRSTVTVTCVLRGPSTGPPPRRCSCADRLAVDRDDGVAGPQTRP